MYKVNSYSYNYQDKEINYRDLAITNGIPIKICILYSASRTSTIHISVDRVRNFLINNVNGYRILF